MDGTFWKALGLKILLTLNLAPALSMKPSATIISPSKTEKLLTSDKLSLSLYTPVLLSSLRLIKPIFNSLSFDSSGAKLMTLPIILQQS